MYKDSRIYQRSLELVRLAKEVMHQMPTGYGFLNDQLRRAVASVTLNFAEGCGKRTLRDRRCYFDRAKGSAYEVTAIFDVAGVFGVIDAEVQGRGADISDHLGAMLSKFK